MTIAELAGWIAAALVVATFTMKTMVRLRIVAIASNTAFITYGILIDSMPTMALHLTLLPFNVYRLWEMQRLLGRVRKATGGTISPAWLRSFNRSTQHKAGEVLFAKGDRADSFYFILDGEVRLQEINVSLRQGEMFGEIAFFTNAAERTMTAQCWTDCELLRVDGPNFRQLMLQNPEFGFFVTRLLAAHLSADVARLEERGDRQI